MKKIMNLIAVIASLNVGLAVADQSSEVQVTVGNDSGAKVLVSPLSVTPGQNIMVNFTDLQKECSYTLPQSLAIDTEVQSSSLGCEGSSISVSNSKILVKTPPKQ